MTARVRAGISAGRLIAPALRYDSKGTAGLSDDEYALWYQFPPTGAPDVTFSQLTSSVDGLGIVRRARSTGTGGRVNDLTLYDVAAAVGRGLDYVQLAQMTGKLTGANEFEGSVSYLGIVNWNAMPALTKSGSAVYKGGLRGSYFKGESEPLDIGGDMAMTVNFSTDSFFGAVSNMKTASQGGPATAPTDDLRFNFDGQLMRSQPTLTVNGDARGGRAADGSVFEGFVYGGFAGAAGGEPTEAALNFALYSNSGVYRMVGVAGLARSTTSPAYVHGATNGAAVAASDCARTPGALTCAPSAVALTSVSAERTRTLDERSLASSVGNGPSYTLDIHGTAGVGDDSYTLTTGLGRTYSALAGVNDGLSALRRGADSTGASELEIYDISNALSGGLDYIQLGRVAGAGYGDRFGVNYFAAFNASASNPLMPTTGSASYAGVTRGTYVSANGGQYRTTGAISMGANFETNSFSGSAKDFQLMPEANLAEAQRLPWSFVFQGALTPGGRNFSGAARSEDVNIGTPVSGTVSGVFVASAPGGPPVEVGLAYSLRAALGDTALYGVGGLKAN